MIFELRLMLFYTVALSQVNSTRVYESKLHTCSDSMNLKANKKFNFLSRASTKQNCSAVRGVLTKLTELYECKQPVSC